MYVILHGNPVDGINIIGPFTDGEAANGYADDNLNGAGEWWVVEVEPPE